MLYMYYIGCAMRKRDVGKLRTYASAQSDQDLSCLLPELLDTTECMNGEQKPG